MSSEFSNELLKAVNNAAASLLATDGEKSFEHSLLSGLESIGRCLDVDRIHIWQNEIHDGKLCFVNKYEWLTEYGKQNSPPPSDAIYEYNDENTPGWERKFLNNEHMNYPVSQMSPNERGFLGSYRVKSIVNIPLFLKNRLWGFFSIDDCRNERTLTDDEISLLRSAGLMMMNAIERNQQDKKLHGVQDYIKLILDATPLACRLWDKDGKILECNEKSVEMFGLNSKQEYMEHYFEFSPEYQPDGEKSEKKFLKTIKKAFEEGKLTIQWMFQKLDGTPIPAEVIIERIPYGDDYLVAGFARDLREHNQMMLEIEYRDTLLRAGNQSAVALLSTMNNDQFEVSLAEGMGHIAGYMDVDRIYIWQNEMVNGEMHYKAKFSWLNGLGRENSNAFLGMSLPLSGFSREFNERLIKNECIKGKLTDLPASDWNLLWGLGVKSVLIIPMFWDGNFWGAVTFDDCHGERSFSESEIDILRSVSLMMISALMRREMTQKIISANEAKSDFLAKMSHEMRTPLNAVLGLAEFTLTEGGLNRATETNLEQIYNAGSTLLSIVNDILDIAKVESGKFVLIPSTYDVPSLINDTIAQNILRAESKPIEFILDIDANMLAQLYGDELRVKQILNNLLSNAFKYTEEGTVTLKISCTRENDTVWVTLKVSDTGIGMTPENLAVLFSDFEQFNIGPNRKVEGTGLGLPITKRMIELMDGHISVESEYGKGSVFAAVIAQKFIDSSVIGNEMADTLKTFRYSDNKRNKNSRINRIKMPYARVLIVDDNVTNLNVTKGFLQPYGMKVDCVTSGQKAIDIIRDEKYKYNAVFMDHMMPGMDGIEATRIIREEIGTDYAKNIPVIAFTANAISGNEKMFLNKGFQAFVPKPIDIYRLDEVVRHWVRDKSKEKYKYAEEQMPEEVELKIGIPGINKIKTIALFGGETELFFSALRSFAENTPPLLDKLKCVTKETINEYAIFVHGFKGSCASIGAEFLREKALHLEMSANEGNISEVFAKNDDLLKDAKILIENINTVLKEYAAGLDKPMLPDPDPALLERLRQCCENYDINGADDVLGKLDAASYKNGESLIAWVRERVIMSEFNEAAAGIAEYIKNQ